MPLAIETRNLTRTFPGASRAAISDVTLRVEEGERVLLTGPSGSGKSTLLNLIGGLDRADSGVLHVNGVDMMKMGEGLLARRRGGEIATVFQHHFLPTGLSAEEVVAAPLLWIHDLSPAEALREAREHLSLLGLSPEEHRRPVQNLSGGQRQRVAFARAIAPGPTILLADEPTAQLDDATAQLLLDQIFDWSAGEGRTLILASHHHLDSWRDGRILHMHDGRLREDVAVA
ncbi:ATP-binding cassette domain-containing protein [Candidatus Sumerlaeota bacterium]|nr:ATP-binding cassette domain-containing protein [Candidatus Sumerlaeota bacterium]